MMIIATTICCRNVSKPHAVTLKKSIFYNPIRLMVPVRIFFLLLLLPCIYDWSDSCLNGSVSCRSLLVQFMFCVLQVITGTVYVLSVYWLSDQPLEFERMGQFLVVCLLIGFVSESLGLSISSRLDIVVRTYQNNLKYHEYIMGIYEMSL